jgi:predicted metal-dependent peptidase
MKKTSSIGEAERKLGRAKARLLLSSPYFGTLASRLELDTSDEIPGVLSNGLKLEYNPDYVETLDENECEFLLANGAMHAALVHERRQNGRMSWLWQLATDHAINALLVQNGFALPPQVNYDPRFEGMYAEAIYAQLKDEIKNEEYSDDESNETGFNENNQRKRDELKNAEGDHDPDKKRPQMEVENTVDESLFEHFEKAVREMMERQGDTPLGLERFFIPHDAPRIDWRSQLSHALNRHLRSDYRLLPPSKKLLYNHIYLPSSTSETLDLVVAVDSSGSVDEALLGRFIAEIESLLETFTDYRVELLVCDAKIQSHHQFYPGEPVVFELRGGGGTDFRPVFEWVDRHTPMAPLLLYFTDCDGRFPETAPFIDTVWITSDEQRSAPFGEMITMSQQWVV